MIAPRPGYVPREQWSASGLSHDRACRRSYGLRYLEGRKEIELTWPEAEALPEPPKAPKGASAVEKERAKAARKAWNKRRRPACGKASHGIQEAYYRQGIPGLWHPPMPWLDLAEAFHTKPGEVLLPGLALMPAPRECDTALIEDAIRLDWSFLPAHLRAQVEADPITFSGSKDLVTVVGGRITLRDLKTTYDFAWIKKPEQLSEEEQANLYALDVCQRFGLDGVECQWVYCRTEGKPAAREVWFTIRRSDAEEVVTALVERALELRDVMRACPTEPEARHLYVMSLPASPDACDDFGGRDCHASRGGPCNARASYAGLIRKLTRPQVAEKGPIPMLNEEQKARLEELRAIPDRNFKQKRELAELEKLDTAPEVGATETAATETKAEPTPAAETPAASAKSSTPKTAKAKATPLAGEIGAEVDGYKFAVPAGTALGKSLAKAAALHKELYASFEGEL
jgi:hypothetical protein